MRPGPPDTLPIPHFSECSGTVPQRRLTKPRKRDAPSPHKPAHGTVRACWPDTQLTHPLQNLTDSVVELERMPVSGLHRQAKIQWNGRNMAINVWQTRRVHIQGREAGNLALPLGAWSESSPR